LDGCEKGVVPGAVADFVGMGFEAPVTPGLTDLGGGGGAGYAEDFVVGWHLGWCCG